MAPLSATASSGLGVMFISNNTSVCEVTGVNVTLVAAGTCSITASQPGNAGYSAAPPATETFTVITGSQSQIITFGALPNVPLIAFSVTLSATSTSGLTVTLASNASPFAPCPGILSR